MTITAKILADSINEQGNRLTTFELTYPRFVHAEFMTHRAFSRNAASSRAIPVKKMIQKVIDDPAIPIWWGLNEPGMQAFAEADAERKGTGVRKWLEARDQAVRLASELADLGFHKQIVNRLIEPWLHITVVCSATEYANFEALRDHKAAEPHMQELAKQMKAAKSLSQPDLLHPGEWHLPFVMAVEWRGKTKEHLLRLIQYSVARCARVSYLNHDQTEPDPVKDRDLYEKLVGGNPLHASPTEHQATPIPPDREGQWSGNFHGWDQYRKSLPQENVPG